MSYQILSHISFTYLVRKEIVDCKTLGSNITDFLTKRTEGLGVYIAVSILSDTLHSIMEYQSFLKKRKAY
jgi:hypothetical protein